MKSFGLLAGIALACAGALTAQEVTTPRFEVGLTYSGVHLDGAQNNTQITGNGGSGYLEYNFNRYLGAVADFGGYANTRDGVNETALTYLFGPRLNWRHKRFNPYVQSLFGGAYAWNNLNSSTQNSFAFALGGGVDVNLTKHLSIKPVQVEYVRSQFDSANLGGATSNFGDHQNGVRYSAGLVLSFGDK